MVPLCEPCLSQAGAQKITDIKTDVISCGGPQHGQTTDERKRRNLSKIQDRRHNHEKSARDKETDTETGFRECQDRDEQDSATLVSLN